MYKIETKQKYYAFNISTNEFLEIGDYISFVYWLKKHLEDHFGLNPNDSYSCKIWDFSTNEFIYNRCPIEWILYDRNFRVIEIKEYLQKAEEDYLKFRFQQKLKRKRKLPDFRSGPVPGTGHNYHWNIRFRCPRTIAELRSNCIEEYKIFVRGKRRILPTEYDDIFSKNSKSWKDCTKKRKQWMK